MPKERRLFQVLKLQKTSLFFDDLEALKELLKTNLSLSDSFDILRNRKNEKILDNIENRLNSGEMIEKIFPDYLSDNLKISFRAFISYLSFRNTLELILSLEVKEKAFLGGIKKDLSYPLLLLSFSVVGIYLFNEYCFEPLVDSMVQLTDDLGSLYQFKEVLNILIVIIFVFLLIFLTLLLYFTRPKRQILAYILLQRHLPNSILKEYLTSQFILFFNECYRIGLKTKDSIEILKHLKEKPLISFLASTVDKGLLEGKTMEEAMKSPYLDEKIARFIKIAMYSGEMKDMLSSYLSSFEKRFKNFCNKWAKIVQVISYAMIAIVIIFVYQILFIPMGVLGEL